MGYIVLPDLCCAYCIDKLYLSKTQNVFVLSIVNAGGNVNGERQDIIFSFNINDQTWTQIGNLKIPRYEHAVDVLPYCR